MAIYTTSSNVWTLCYADGSPCCHTYASLPDLALDRDNLPICISYAAIREAQKRILLRHRTGTDAGCSITMAFAICALWAILTWTQQAVESRKCQKICVSNKSAFGLIAVVS
nr:hypothetical protein CFP56_50392 [Quercus suber]